MEDKMVESKETRMTLQFIEKALDQPKRPRCVDGRPADDSDLGPQMLGGSIHLLAISSIFENLPLNRQTVVEKLGTIKENGGLIGAHRDDHAQGDDSGCGFSDRLPDIIKTAQEKQPQITQRLVETYEANRHLFDNLNLPPIHHVLDEAYSKIKAYDSSEQIKIKGKSLVDLIENSGKVETVQGNHAEEVAFVNIDAGSTLDTNNLNEQGKQAFNLDLIQAVSQAKTLGIPESFAIPASLILYQATEMVLVEDKGKPALPVRINS